MPILGVHLGKFAGRALGRITVGNNHLAGALIAAGEGAGLQLVCNGGSAQWRGRFISNRWTPHTCGTHFQLPAAARGRDAPWLTIDIPTSVDLADRIQAPSG
jgi:hypothetical protein